MNEKKLIEKCEVLEKLIVATAEIYNDPSTTHDQKAILETTIGAAIWYLPSGDKLYSCKISQSALTELENNPKVKLTKEHKYPRKQAGRKLLEEIYKDITLQKVKLVELYLKKFGVYNYVLSKENKKLIEHQKNDTFVDEESAYDSAGIELVDLPLEKLKVLQKKKSNDKMDLPEI